MLELLDDIFRFSAIFCCVLTAALAHRDARCSLVGYLAIILALCIACFLLVSKPGVAALIGPPLVVLKIFSMVSPAALWLFAQSLFDDKFTLRPVHGVVVGSYWLLEMGYLLQYYLVYGKIDALTPPELHASLASVPSVWFAVLHTVTILMQIGMIAHMLYVAWQGRDDDLLEGRRKFRTTFVVAGAIVTVVVIYSFGIPNADTAGSLRELDLAITIGVFLVVSYLLWNVVRIDSDWLLGDLRPIKPKTVAQRLEPTLSTQKVAQQAYMEESDDHCDLSPADKHDLEAVLVASRSELLFESGLTISRLADIIAIPEHRLRHLINQHMGFRNFSDFLNCHRIDAAKSRLSDTRERHTPVLTIAMDLGYGSLGPFNRAFKERTGQTPTEFRSQALFTEAVAVG